MITQVILLMALLGQSGNGMVIGLTGNQTVAPFEVKKPSVKKRPVRRHKRKVSLPMCTPNYGDPVPYYGKVYPPLTGDNITLPNDLGIFKQYSIQLTPVRPTSEPKAHELEIQSGTIEKILVLEGILADNEIVPYKMGGAWEKDSRIKSGDYVLVPKAVLHDLLKEK